MQTQQEIKVKSHVTHMAFYTLGGFIFYEKVCFIDYTLFHVIQISFIRQQRLIVNPLTSYRKFSTSIETTK